jgi:2,3-bisphosphoglycerate-independent phosphoglycerate mutase
MSNHRHSRGAAALGNAVKDLYAEGQNDYYLDPIVLCDDAGAPVGRIHDGDGVVFCCRRGEREIQLTEAFTEPGFAHFPLSPFQTLPFAILTLYHEKFKDLPVAFAPSKIGDTLGETVSRAGLRQMRTAESEKFAHVTFFFNGGNNQPFPGEEDVRIPSPKGIPYDQVPELSLPQVAEQVLRGVEQGVDLIVTNFANGDVIGHLTNNNAKLRCAEVVDTYLGQVMQAASRAGYIVLVTADHGNLEEMTTPEGGPHVSHTTNRVACVITDPRSQAPIHLRDGILADVAPTVLHMLGVDQPAAMTGSTLAPGQVWGGRRVLLIILDGWGMGREDEGNPIFLADTPVWDDLLNCSPTCFLDAAGSAVGLQPGKAGNSEAGHMNIGAGRVVAQDDVRLNQAMQDGSFYTNEVLGELIDGVRQRGAALHLIGLLTEKSSHGSIDYPLALLRMARERGLQQVYIHMIFDGRSTEPGSAPALLELLEERMDEIGLGQIVTGVGRGLALDRDGNYHKTQRAYDALVSDIGKACAL